MSRKMCHFLRRALGRMVATQSYMLSSSFGPALQYRGGSRLISASSARYAWRFPPCPLPVFFQFHLLPLLLSSSFSSSSPSFFFFLSFVFFWRALGSLRQSRPGSWPSRARQPQQKKRRRCRWPPRRRRRHPGQEMPRRRGERGRAVAEEEPGESLPEDADSRFRFDMMDTVPAWGP